MIIALRHRDAGIRLPVAFLVPMLRADSFGIDAKE